MSSIYDIIGQKNFRTVFCPLYLAAEEADGRQIGLDGGGGLLLFLHMEHIGSQELAADICQLLQAELLREEFTEPLHGLIAALLGAKAALTVVPGGLVAFEWSKTNNSTLKGAGQSVKRSAPQRLTEPGCMSTSALGFFYSR